MRAKLLRRLHLHARGHRGGYGLTITDSDGKVAARGGIMERVIAAQTLPGTDIVRLALGIAGLAARRRR